MKNRLKLSLLSMGLAALGGAHLPGALAQPVVTLPAQAFGASKPIPGRYIVVLKNTVIDVPTQALALAKLHGGQVQHVYEHALKGFAISLPAVAVQALKNNPLVDYIEQDQTVALREAPVAQAQNQATWGLDRIDQVTRPMDSVYRYNYKGAGVNAFVIDTGLRADHIEFTGRTKPGYNVAPDSTGAVNSANTADCNGHGTHVAGTVGGSVLGVAKAVSLIPVRVLDCAGSGSSSGVIAGINWVAASTLRPAVANLSLGMSGVSTAVNSAVAGAVGKGVTVVVAAGNSNVDACTSSPGSEPSAITVGATDSNDARASYSNWGSCLDLFAPGSSITSAWYTASNAAAVLSGTSMASPHVAGVAALALAANPSATPTDVAAFLTSKASLNQLGAIGTGSPNRLVYSLAAGAPTTVAKQVIAVKSLAAASTKTTLSWTPGATVTVRNVSTGALVANATVNGSFNPGGAKSCVTTSAGSCKLSGSSLVLTTASSTLTVTGMSGTNMAYDGTQNAATQIVLKRP
ncbi:MAG: S8 family peptidase [Burkholderiaceae bacterium]|nr:S8 family peptidase [Burkholderiaceae bacterium]